MRKRVLPRRWKPLLLPAAVLLLLAAALPAPSQELELTWAGDGVLLGTSLAAAAVSEYLVSTGPVRPLGASDVEQINGFDRLALFPYSRPLDITSTVVEYTILASPAVLALYGGWERAAILGVIYLETLAYADAAKNFLKYFFPRYRPYVYSPLPSGTGPGGNERVDSFPSGHATMSFAAASFGAYVLRTYYPSSPLLVPLTVAGYGLATLTAALRVFSGMHFMTDVLAGALLGTALGYVVPLLHRAPGNGRRDAGLSLEVAPTVVLFRYGY